MKPPAVVKKRLLLPNRSGDMMHADVRFAEGSTSRPVLVICHSFMAFKEWGFFPHAAERLAESGFVCVTFNFSHNGVALDGNRITELARFEKNTFSQELDDLGALLDGLSSDTTVQTVGDVRRLVLLGHSRGGGIALVCASEDARVKALVTWSAIATFDRWTAHQKHAWEASGFLPLARNTTVSPLRLGTGILRDIEAHGDRLNLSAAAARLAKPWLILHGEADVTVPAREARSLYGASDPAVTELRVLEHVGHLYNAATRAEDNFQTLDAIIGVSVQWLHRTLS